MARKLSTRRAKIEERQARKQVFIAFLVTGVIGLVFLFVLLPLILRVAISLARNENPFQTELQDTLPPQLPVIEPIPPFRQEKNVEIKGFTEAEAIVKLVVDGKEHSQQTAGQNGSFTFSLTMDEGEHQFWLFAEDKAGNSSGITKQFVVTIDTTKPSLEVSDPQNNQVFTLPREKTMDITGKMSEKGRVFVNGNRNSTDEEGNFTTRLQLSEGENIIKLYAEDEAGNRSDEQELKVEYRP